MKISDSFLRECIEEKIEGAVKHGVRRAYKHSDKEPPSGAQIEQIVESVKTAIVFDVLDWDEVSD